MSEICVLLIGDTRRREFRRARASLDDAARVREAPDAEEAEVLLAGGRFLPEVIVVAQSHPGQFSARQIDRLRRLAPLARVLALLGSWCEGEVRTGNPWPAVIRVYWHQWLPCWRQELARLRQGECPAWGLPVTASEEDRLLASAEAPAPTREGLIAICSPCFEMQDWLAAACRGRGYSTEWIRPHRPTTLRDTTAAIFDATDCRGEELDQLKRFAAVSGEAPVLALLDFPRIEDEDLALAAGAVAVLAKPLLLEDLFWQLDQMPANTPSR